MNDAEEKLYPTITPAKRNALIKISQITPIVTDQVFLCLNQFWNTCMMRVTLIADNNVVLWKVC